MTLSALLEKISSTAFFQAFPEASRTEKKIVVNEASSEEFGHFQCNYALQVAKQLKLSPQEIAQKWVKAMDDFIQNHPDYPGVIASLEIKGPGFINFRVHPEYLAKLLTTSMKQENFGIETAKPPLKIIIDYSSPNIAKEMHVGHLRSTIIGDTLNRVFTLLGHQVLALNHVGDWGTQFGMLIAYIKNNVTSASKTISQANLSDLVHWYKEAKKLFDSDPNFKKQAQLEVVSLQNKDKNSLETWGIICEISRNAYQHIYKLLAIDPNLTERGESYYDTMLADTVKRLEQVQINGKNLVTLSEGAKCIFLEGYTNREGEPLPLILQKSDGGYNYATTDLAALYHRVKDEKGDCILYVVDAGQSLHFEMVFKAAALAGFYDPNKTRIEHVPFGLVLRSDGKKFKTREGDTERLIDLIHTAIEKAKTILQTRNPEIDEKQLQFMAETLGINAIKYADLACHRASNYMFSYDRMLQFEGNTAAFIMYAYVRILSIQRKIAQKAGMEVNDLIGKEHTLVLEAPAEIALAVLLCQFEDVLIKMQHDLEPHRLTEYLYRLAEKFHAFFHQCRVEGSEQQSSRLLLCIACAQVLKQGMMLLGLRPLDYM